MAKHKTGTRYKVLKGMIETAIKLKKMPKIIEIVKEINHSTATIYHLFGDMKGVKSKLREYLSFDKKGKLLSTNLKKELVAPSAKDEIIREQEDEIHHLNAELRQFKKAKKDTQVNKNFYDRIISTLTDEARALPKPRQIVPPRYKKSGILDEEALLLLSDAHAGEVVDNEEMGGLNQYNFTIFRKRIQHLTDKCIKILSTEHPIKKLNIHLLGDIVSGNIHEELRRTNEGNILDQVLMAAHVIATSIAELSAYWPIQVVGVIGNHGRLDKKPSFKERYVNWDMVVYQFIKLMLKDNPRISCKFPKSFFTVESILGHKILDIHGDNVRGWMGLPFYGINKMAKNMLEVLVSKGDKFDYIVLGHFHSTGQLDRCKGELILNGSIIGGNEFAMGAMFTFSPPKQLLIGMHPKYGMTWRYPMQLQYGDEEIPDDKLRYTGYQY